MKSITTIKRAIDQTAKLAGLLTAAALIGAMIVLTGCNAVIGVGRDLAEAGTFTHQAIQSQLRQPQGQQRAIMTYDQWRREIGD